MVGSETESILEGQENASQTPPSTTPTSKPPPSGSSYNKLYEKLVLASEDDTTKRLEGMIAYGIYKLKKNRFYQAYYKEHNKNPSVQDETNFLLQFKNDQELKELRETACTMLYRFAEGYSKAEEEKLRVQIKDEFVVRAVQKGTSWWRAILASFWGAIAYSIIMALLVAFFTIAKPDSQAGKAFKAFTQSLLEDNPSEQSEQYLGK